MTMNLWDSLMRHVSPEPNSGCWLWTAAVNDSGYAICSVNRKAKRAHRILYVLIGRTIPDGLQLDHKCRVRCCVNPDHLEPVTNRENTLRGIVAEVHRRRFALITHCPRNHPYDERNTYIDRRGRRSCKSCWREKAAERRLRNRIGK